MFNDEVTKKDIEDAYGFPFVEYAIASLEQYGFHHTAHLQWDELKRLARLGSYVEKLPPHGGLHHDGNDDTWNVYLYDDKGTSHLLPTHKSRYKSAEDALWTMYGDKTCLKK